MLSKRVLTSISFPHDSPLANLLFCYKKLGIDWQTSRKLCGFKGPLIHNDINIDIDNELSTDEILAAAKDFGIHLTITNVALINK